MKISIITLFPEMFLGPFSHSILKRAQQKELLTIEYINIRDFGIGKHKLVDDTPYGGGVGMVLRVDVLELAINKAKCPPKDDQPLTDTCKERIILTDARGQTYTQKKAQTLSKYDHLILIAGHYEGVDERITTLVDESLSIGDYILTGGEIPIMVFIDSIVRLIPSVLSKTDATRIESFSKEDVKEFPHYTKPQVWKNKKVPPILLSGNHKQIETWRQEKSLKKQK